MPGSRTGGCTELLACREHTRLEGWPLASSEGPEEGAPPVLRKEPIPSHCRYLGCDESQSPPPSLRWRCARSQSPPTACYLAAAGSQSLHQGSWRSCRKEPAHPWAASVSSRRRTQGRAAPPSPVSQPGWRSERALGGRGATFPPVASCLPSPLRTGQTLLPQPLRESKFFPGSERSFPVPQKGCGQLSSSPRITG